MEVSLRSHHSMSSKDFLSMQSCLTCYLCGEIFHRPRVLPCGHTFCSECLANVRDEILQDGKTRRDDVTTHVSVDSEDSQPVSMAESSMTSSLSPDTLDMSSNVDYIQPVDDVSCYRPHVTTVGSPVTRRSANNSSHHHNQVVPNGITRSSTFSSQRPMYTERSPSRFSAPAGVGTSMTNSLCSNCGNSSTRRSKSAQRSSSSTRISEKKTRSSSTPRWDNSPQKFSISHTSAPACSFEHRHGREMEQFVCPLPECGYSLRIMNLARWSPRNRTVADVVAAWRRLQMDKRDSSTQTDISIQQSLIVTIPRSLMDERSVWPISRRRRHSSLVDSALSHAISMDSLERGYVPRGHFSWRSYAAMVGMNILHQIVNL